MRKATILFITTAIFLLATGCTDEWMDESVDSGEERTVASGNDSPTDDLVTEQQAIEVANAFFDTQAGMPGLRNKI